MWQAYAEAGEAADPQHPALRQYTSGDALQTLTKALQGFQKKGHVTRGRPVLQPQVESSKGKPISEVEIDDCADTTTWLIYRKSGGLVNDVPGGRRAIGATVKKTDGAGWKVSLFGVREVGTC